MIRYENVFGEKYQQAVNDYKTCREIVRNIREKNIANTVNSVIKNKSIDFFTLDENFLKKAKESYKGSDPTEKIDDNTLLENAIKPWSKGLGNIFTNEMVTKLGAEKMYSYIDKLYGEYKKSSGNVREILYKNLRKINKLVMDNIDLTRLIKLQFDIDFSGIGATQIFEGFEGYFLKGCYKELEDYKSVIMHVKKISDTHKLNLINDNDAIKNVDNWGEIKVSNNANKVIKGINMALEIEKPKPKPKPEWVIEKYKKYGKHLNKIKDKFQNISNDSELLKSKYVDKLIERVENKYFKKGYKIPDIINDLDKELKEEKIDDFYEFTNALEKLDELAKYIYSNNSNSDEEDNFDNRKPILSDKLEDEYNNKKNVTKNGKIESIKEIYKDLLSAVNSSKDPNKELFKISSKKGVIDCLKNKVLRGREKKSSFSKSNDFAKSIIKYLEEVSSLSKKMYNITVKHDQDSNLEKNDSKSAAKKLKKHLRSNYPIGDGADAHRLFERSKLICKELKKLLKDCESDAKKSKDGLGQSLAKEYLNVLGKINKINSKAEALNTGLEKLMKKYSQKELDFGVPLFADRGLNQILRAIIFDASISLVYELYGYVHYCFYKTSKCNIDEKFKELKNLNVIINDIK